MAQMEGQGAALVLQGLSKTFGVKKAVDALDLTVPRGSTFGLLGPNGAGKSTTIRMALNIYIPDTGTVRIFGEPHGDATVGRIGYLPEERGLYNKMKVGDMLTFLAAIKGVPSRDASPRIDRWLERVELPGVRDKKVQELSKGMQQKVQFIATVLHEPDLIVLDEPFSGLDPINTNVLKDIIVDLRAQGRTIVFSTHIMEQAERLCDSIALINGGRKVLDGPLSTIKNQYGRNAVALSFDGDGSFLRGHRLVRSVNPYNTFVEVRLSDGADPQELLREVAGRVRVTRFEIV
ncbi:MAG TPA: ATP-binding cassette domain-containing protein, partial [Candidatus Polarisedimenticolia bacterium]|nr:ATP-binding cassette domain-containing protein [Candidatus Polarisedimenticolia bacterium]